MKRVLDDRRQSLAKAQPPFGKTKTGSPFGMEAGRENWR